MGDFTIRQIPDDEPDTVPITIAGTDPLVYTITDKGKTIGTINTSQQGLNDAPVLSNHEIAERVLWRKARELSMIRRALKQEKANDIRTTERNKQKRKNRKKNKVARASRKRNK